MALLYQLLQNLSLLGLVFYQEEKGFAKKTKKKEKVIFGFFDLVQVRTF